MTNDNFLVCCGKNATANLNETEFCKECNQFAYVVVADLEWMDGSQSYTDRGVIKDVTGFKPSLKAFIDDSPNHALAAVSVLMMFLSFAALVILVGGAK